MHNINNLYSICHAEMNTNSIHVLISGLNETQEALGQMDIDAKVMDV